MHRGNCTKSETDHCICQDRELGLKANINEGPTIRKRDNMRNFLFDALKGVVLVDDDCIISLTAMKELDSVNSCEGRSVISIRRVE